MHDRRCLCRRMREAGKAATADKVDAGVGAGETVATYW